MKFILHKTIENVSIYCRKGIVYKVSKGFLNLTHYSESEVLGKTIFELTSLLKLHSQIDLEKMDRSKEAYVFIKEGGPIKVNISSQPTNIKDEKVYFLKETDSPCLDSILDNISSFNLDDKGSIAIYSLEDCILLGCNQQYIELLSELNLSTKELFGERPKISKFLLSYDKSINYNYQTEVYFKNKAHKDFYFDISLIPLYENRKGKYLLNIIQDVTERVLNRKYLEKQKKQIEIILDNVSDQVIVFNKAGDHVYVNKEAQRKMDLLFKDKLKNNKLVFDESKIVTVDGKKILFESTPSKRVLKGEKFSDYRYIGCGKYNIGYYRTRGLPLYDERNNLSEGVLIYQDITDKMMMEEYDILKERTIDDLLVYGRISYPDFKIIYINRDGYRGIKYVNPHVKNLLSIIGKSLFEFCKSSKEKKNKLINDVKRTIEENKSSLTFTEKLIKDDSYRYIKIIFRPIYGKENKVNNISIIGMDISEEKKSNQKLSKALKSQEEMFVNTSHELKTPLNLIFSASQLLEQVLKKSGNENLNEEISYSNKIILQNCYRLTKLINNILDISKLESGFYKLNLMNEDIVHITEDIISSVAEYIKKKKLNIVFDTNVEEKIMALDLYKFERIMLNLISNAIKFSNPGGTIFVNLYDRGDFIDITVEDQGIGIDKKNLENIFKKFYQVNKSLTRRSEGTGIGLSLIKSLVELHKGQISVESSLGKGTIFKISFPNIVIKNQKVNKIENGSRVETIKFELSDIY